MPDLPTRLRAESHSDGYSYLLSLPNEEADDAATRWPLILFLHGIRERGTDVWEVTRQGLPKLLHGQPDLTTDIERDIGAEVAAKFIVIAPQCARDEVWDTAALLALLDNAGREFRIDARRMYATGLSMGGFGTWALGMRHPLRLAAIVPVCGGGRIADIATALRGNPDTLRTLGVWAFHGAKDRTVPLDESERMIDALKSAGVAEVKFTVYPEAQHDSWSAAYSTRELYAWLLTHTR